MFDHRCCTGKDNVAERVTGPRSASQKEADLVSHPHLVPVQPQPAEPQPPGPILCLLMDNNGHSRDEAGGDGEREDESSLQGGKQNARKTRHRQLG